jgi:hypothetical protein
MAIGPRLTNALALAGSTESIVLLEDPETLDAELIQEEEAEGKGEAWHHRDSVVPGPQGARWQREGR